MLANGRAIAHAIAHAVAVGIAIGNDREWAAAHVVACAHVRLLA